LSLSDSPYANRTKIISFGTPEYREVEDNSLSIFRKIDGWNLGYEASQDGTISISASKPIGRISGYKNDDRYEATIELTVKTTKKRVPLLRKLGYDIFDHQKPKYIEVDDGLGRKTESFKKDDDIYKLNFAASSILEPLEFFSEIIPEFQKLVNDKSLGEHITKIADEVSRVQKPYDRSYEVVK
jgi:hypothetical protein